MFIWKHFLLAEQESKHVACGSGDDPVQFQLCHTSKHLTVNALVCLLLGIYDGAHQAVKNNVIATEDREQL